MLELLVSLISATVPMKAALAGIKELLQPHVSMPPNISVALEEFSVLTELRREMLDKLCNKYKGSLG